MGLLCSRHKRGNQATAEENARAADIERRIEQETKAEQHIQKLLLLGAGESGKSTIFKQIKLLFQTGFDERELQSYTSVIHANVYQTIKELDLSEEGSSKYGLSVDNKEIGEKLSEIGGRLDYPRLTAKLVQDILKIWKDPAIQRLSDTNYIPSKEDVLHARVRTTGVVEIQFSPVGENKKSGEVYRLFDVGGQRNERRKWIHLFEGVRAVIFCAAISEFVKKKFEELYYQNVTCDHQDRVFKIYRTTALDQKLVKKTFKLVDETLRRRNLFEAGLL
ncbi:hypothetical protein L1987_70387 [Smallanthus sonchifolius]|uniref:Uncharacterized protein n=1 Tax=Smallanthus sonchifolius TaxID=185202 RepID=A0ACB9ANP2_9ASTR|nr:hypothetical protein L1987_70387 [Smallanthus sonchifolius]